MRSGKKTEMNKRIVCTLTALFCVFLLTACGSNGYAPVLRANWNLTLPDRCREVYEIDSGASFQGDGERCHVFSFEDADAVAETLTAWAGEAGRAAGGTGIAETAEEILTGLAVPAEERPNYENSQYWFTVGTDDSRDQILVFLDRGAGKLYVVERFM